MIPHCVFCKHWPPLDTVPDLSFMDRSTARWMYRNRGVPPRCRGEGLPDDVGFSHPCRELTEFGAYYHYFEPADDSTGAQAAAVDWLLQAFDQMEYRLKKIEDGLRRAAER